MNDKPERMTAAEWVVLFLLFCGLALIAAGLWMFCRPLALVFVGIACWYVAACVSKAANSPERTDKK